MKPNKAISKVKFFGETLYPNEIKFEVTQGGGLAPILFKGFLHLGLYKSRELGSGRNKGNKVKEESKELGN